MPSFKYPAEILRGFHQLFQANSEKSLKLGHDTILSMPFAINPSSDAIYRQSPIYATVVFREVQCVDRDASWNFTSVSSNECVNTRKFS